MAKSVAPEVMGADPAAVITYLETLIKEGILSDTQSYSNLLAALQSDSDSWRKFITSLRSHLRGDPVTMAVQNEILDHYEHLPVSDNGLRPLKEWLKADVQLMQQSNVLKTEVVENTKAVYRLGDFIPISGGKFKVVYDDTHVMKKKITENFELMDSHVTEFQYHFLLLDPANWKKEKDEYFSVNANENLNLPITRISYFDAELFVGKLNELSDEDDPRMREVFQGHRPGDHYAFLRDDQYEWLLQKAVTESGEEILSILDRNDSDLLREYAVMFDLNRPYGPLPVASKKPFFLFGKPVYDLIGNTKTWIQDEVGYNRERPAGTDQTPGPPRYFRQVTRGGSFGSEFSFLRRLRDTELTADRAANTGLRIIRYPARTEKPSWVSRLINAFR